MQSGRVFISHNTRIIIIVVLNSVGVVHDDERRDIVIMVVIITNGAVNNKPVDTDVGCRDAARLS